MVQQESLEKTYHDYYPLLFAIAYRMLGSASDAEDIVQECYLRYAQASPKEIHSTKSYLTTIVTHLCLDYLKSARRQREQYVGVWLPEPILTTDQEEPAWHTLEQHESISLAFLLLLERLTPYERAVFLLREIFSYRYEEISEIVGKSATYCRQIFHQAKAHLSEHRRRYTAPSQEAQERLVERFLAASQQGEVQALAAVLAEDVSWWADIPVLPLSIRTMVTGGLMPTPRRSSLLLRSTPRSMQRSPSPALLETSVEGSRCGWEGFMDLSHLQRGNSSAMPVEGSPPCPDHAMRTFRRFGFRMRPALSSPR